MKITSKMARALQSAVYSSDPYLSRRELSQKHKVKRILKNFVRKTSRGLGDTEVIDRYLTDAHHPPEDLLTELRGYGATATPSKTSILLALGIIALIFYMGKDI